MSVQVARGARQGYDAGSCRASHRQLGHSRQRIRRAKQLSTVASDLHSLLNAFQNCFCLNDQCFNFTQFFERNIGSGPTDTSRRNGSRERSVIPPEYCYGKLPAALTSGKIPSPHPPTPLTRSTHPP